MINTTSPFKPIKQGLILFSMQMAIGMIVGLLLFVAVWYRLIPSGMGNLSTPISLYFGCLWYVHYVEKRLPEQLRNHLWKVSLYSASGSIAFCIAVYALLFGFGVMAIPLDMSTVILFSIILLVLFAICFLVNRWFLSMHLKCLTKKTATQVA